MTKDEMKNRISMALKDPILQQGFEIICKENAELRKHNEEVIALLNAERERQEKCDDVHLRTIADLEKENAELKEINKGYCRSRDRLISMGFPNFKDCKEYVDQLTKAKEIIRDLLSCLYSVEYDRVSDLEEAEQFIKDSEVEK